MHIGPLLGLRAWVGGGGDPLPALDPGEQALDAGAVTAHPVAGDGVVRDLQP